MDPSDVFQSQPSRADSTASNESGSKSVSAQHSTGPDALHAVKNMHLRKVMREAHSLDVTHLAYYRRVIPGDGNANLMATVAGNQACIYDNENCGDHLDMTFGYVNNGDFKGDLTCCAWIRRDCDPNLVISGTDPVVQIVNLREGRVSDIMEIEENDFRSVVQLSATTHDDGFLAALVDTKSGSVVYAWNSSDLRFLGKFRMSSWISSICVDYSESCVYASSYSGTIERRVIDNRSTENPSKKPKIADIEVVYCHHLPIDLVISSGDGRIYAKVVHSMNQILVIDTNERKLVQAIPSPESGPRYGMDISADNRFLCLGTPAGKVHIYDTAIGKQVKVLECSRNGRRLKQCNIRSVMFSSDNLRVAHTGSDGMVFRWDYVDPEYLRLFDAPPKK